MSERSLLSIVLATAVLLGMSNVQAAEKPHLFLLTESRGFVHEVVKRKDGKPAVVEQIFQQLADSTGFFTLQTSQDASEITPQLLAKTRIIVFYTTGDLPISDENFKAFVEWIRAGNAFFGVHSTSNTFHGRADFLDIINGEFDGHPWSQNHTVTLKVQDTQHPASRVIPQGHTFKEEIYQFKNFNPDAVRVLVSLDMEKTELKRPYHIPVAWCKEYGKGKVFYTSLGHREDVWTSEVFQAHLVGAIRWLLELDQADATPNPELHQRENEIAKRAVEQQANLPAVPEGFKINVFCCAPDIYSPASIAVTPQGAVFVGEDEYNTGHDTTAGIARVKMCADTTGDGRADRITVFADKLNSPQGMLYVGGTLYVAHAPYLSAFRDTDGDGVADERVDIVTGFGPEPQGLVHHIPSGLRMGPDGFLYISIGDKGIEHAVGTDGRTARLHGGGVLRVLPDGTRMEVFSWRTRNTYDVAVDPFLNVFTRDNTNDGDGWWSRLMHMQRDAEYGYPSLYKNYADEIITPIADYGSGSATGAIYIHEPWIPEPFGNALFTCDWGKGIVFWHKLTPNGATFDLNAEEFIKGIRPTNLEVDGEGRMYLADWGRGGWRKSDPIGTIYRIVPASARPPPFPNLSECSEDELLEHLGSESSVRRIEALCELVRRGGSDGLAKKLTRMAMKPQALEARVAALFALARIEGEEAQSALAMLSSISELREFAIRALGDMDDARRMNLTVIEEGLNDTNPRVRVQSAIAMGRLARGDSVAKLIPLTADHDVMVRHAAMQALRRLNAIEVCLDALRSETSDDIRVGVLRTMRTFHDARVIEAASQLAHSDSSQTVRHEAIRTLARIYQTEGPWDGSWWGTRPDPRGPYVSRMSWEHTGDVGREIARLIDHADADTARVAIHYVGLCRVDEGIGRLAQIVKSGGTLRNEAAQAIVDAKSARPESLEALAMIALGAYDMELRTHAVQMLGSIDSPAASSTVIELARKTDRAGDVPDALVDRIAEAMEAKPAPLDRIDALAELVGASGVRIREAAATALLRREHELAHARIRSLLQSDSVTLSVAVLGAARKIEAEKLTPFRDDIAVLLKNPEPDVRRAAMAALGHMGDASAVGSLLTLGRRELDPVPVALALASIAPEKIADEQIFAAAQFLAQTSTRASKQAREHYTRVFGAAHRFASDARLSAEQRASLFSQLKEPGIIPSYLWTGALPATPGSTSYATVYPPELSPAGPFEPFSVNGREVQWTPVEVDDPRGLRSLEMSSNTVAYLTTTIDAPVRTRAQLSVGSDDGIQIWLNGSPVLAREVDRSLRPDLDKAMVRLRKGENVLLLKVNNNTGVAGVQARLRWRTGDFDLEELTGVLAKLKNRDIERGRALFETTGCIKCHTLDRAEDMRGPFLGDAAARFDTAHLVESIINPGDKIAQGFESELVTMGDASNPGRTEFVGFVVREGADEIHLRDAAGAAMVVPKSRIISRRTLPGSVMPDGLVDALTLDDFASLMGFLESLKPPQ